jgi:Na+-transporting methylmalonyl-CoA/oxaloacetate decarboxylase beta subunit
MGSIAVRKDGEVFWIWFEMFRAELFSTIAMRPFTVSYNFKVLGATFLTVSNTKKGLFPVLTRVIGKCVYPSALEGVGLFAFGAVYVGAKPRQNQPGAETT